MESIEQRLARIESSMRRWRALSLCLALLPLACLFLAATSQQENRALKARSLEVESILVQKAAGGPSVGMTVAENHALLTLNGPPIEGKPAMGMVFVMAGPDSVTFSLSQGADTRNVGGNDRLDKMIRNGLLVKVSEERTTLHAGRDGQGSLEFASEPVKGKHLFVSGPGKLPQTFTAP